MKQGRDDEDQPGSRGPPIDQAAEAAREAAEWDDLRREANAIDPQRYRKRGRLLAAAGVGALGAGVVWVVMAMTTSARNPCNRLRDHFCGAGASSNCAIYEGILADSVEDASSRMRSMVRDQCLTKIKRLEAEDGVKVP